MEVRGWLQTRGAGERQGEGSGGLQPLLSAGSLG